MINNSFLFKIKLCIANLLLLTLIVSTLWPLTVFANVLASEEAILERQSIPVESNQIENWPTGPIISARAAILMDAESGAILYEKNAHEMLYPASTTKIMTALLALENIPLDEVITFSYDAVFSVPVDGSNIAIDVNEQLTMDQCLQAILIASANEVTNGIAEYISEDMDSFAALMTERAAALGCLNTNFTNANGLHDDNHYTTAYDLALIARAFVANELLCKVSTSSKLHFLPTDRQPDEIIAYNQNKLLAGGTYQYDSVIATKTGYTDNALSTLFTCAEQGNMRLICIILQDLAPAQYTDTVALLDYGFQNFDSINVSQVETKYDLGLDTLYDTNTSIFDNSSLHISLSATDTIIVPKTINFEDLTSSLNYDTEDNNTLAEIDYYYYDTYVGSASILVDALISNTYTFDDEVGEEVSSSNESSVIFINILVIFAWIIGIAVFIIVLIFVFNFFSNYNFNTSRRNEWKKRRKKYRATYSRQNAHTRRRIRRNKKQAKKSKTINL